MGGAAGAASVTAGLAAESFLLKILPNIEALLFGLGAVSLAAGVLVSLVTGVGVVVPAGAVEFSVVPTGDVSVAVPVSEMTGSPTTRAAAMG